MLGIPLRYLLKNPKAAADLAADPVEVVMTAADVYVAEQEGRRPRYEYQLDNDWERHLHELQGKPWPCATASEFWALWPQVMSELEVKGIQPGPQSFGPWNDGDTGLVRSIWCLVRHTKPNNVIETGVAHGVTSRFILEALERNGRGHLWSIDLPPLEKDRREQVGMAVGGRYPDRWTYIKGSSRRRLPELLSRVGQIDLFIHDSLHSERNVRFELDLAWPAVRGGGAIVVDDVDANWGFRSFTQGFPDHESMVCEAEPLRPDLRRYNNRGLFGIILKSKAMAARS
jgi:Methyltransferase domain